MKFTYWKDSEYCLGFWNDYPDYQTQGMGKEAKRSGSSPYARLSRQNFVTSEK
jgi:hypothetical protein